MQQLRKGATGRGRRPLLRWWITDAEDVARRRSRLTHAPEDHHIDGHREVVKVQLVVLNGLPAASLIAPVPPVRVTVNLVFAARVGLGLSVTTRVEAL
jgi:hypothetical protein